MKCIRSWFHCYSCLLSSVDTQWYQLPMIKLEYYYWGGGWILSTICGMSSCHKNHNHMKHILSLCVLRLAL